MHENRIFWLCIKTYETDFVIFSFKVTFQYGVLWKFVKKYFLFLYREGLSEDILLKKLLTQWENLFSLLLIKTTPIQFFKKRIRTKKDHCRGTSMTWLFIAIFGFFRSQTEIFNPGTIFSLF